MTPYSELAVIDVETTGFSKQDRVLELAIVIVDAHSHKVTERWHSLINPERGVGPTHVHGVTESMVRSAPRFAEVAGHIGALLSGRVLVAHNLSFDERFMYQEFNRLPWGFDAGLGICTYKLSGMKLDVACARHGVRLDGHHRALSDAEAAAALLPRLKVTGRSVPVEFSAQHQLVRGATVKTR